MYSNKTAAKTFGIAFLIGYLSYGLGFGLLNTNINDPNGLSYIFQHQNLVIFEAAVLMAICAPINIVLGALMTPIFKRFNPTLAYGYLSAAIVASILLMVGAIFLLASLPISEAYATATLASKKELELLFAICLKANFFSYQIAMVAWGVGGLIFAYLLLISKLVPNWLSVWGIIGYIIFIAGAFFALFGYPIDIYLDIPGGLFEIYLSIRWIVKGFDTSNS